MQFGLQGTPPPVGTALKYELVVNETMTLRYQLFWNQWCILDYIDLKSSEADSTIGLRLGNYKSYVQGDTTAGYWVSL